MFEFAFNLMDQDKHESLFKELCTNIKQQAEKSLKTLIEQVLDIENFLKNDCFSQSESTNLNLIINPVQNYLRNFIETVEHLTIWLELEIPSYSDSHEFSISVQNQILDEIASMKTNCITYMSQIVDYREQRATANKELLKRPQLNDNHYLIVHLDYQLHRNLKFILIEIKSYILRINNILTKNKDFIYQPSFNHQHINNYF